MALPLSVLALQLHRRPVVQLSNGSKQDARTYLDFVVDNHSIGELGASLGYDLVSVLAREWLAEERERSLRRLLLAEPADFPNNRRSLLVCSECGDLGCGAVSVRIEMFEDEVTWADFGYENNYHEMRVEGFRQIGPFRFERRQYENTLAGAMTLLQGAHES